MLTLLLALLACDDAGPTDDTASFDTAAAPQSHDADLQPLWDRSCGGCHLGGGDAGGLELDDGFVMVGKASRQADLPLVAPGDLEGSYLWHKLDGTHRDVGGSGERMPKSRPALGADDLARVEAWILAGAPR